MPTLGTSVAAYSVTCNSCHDVWQPAPGSPLWWQAKQRAESGFLDALCVSGQKCGCVQDVSQPEARYRVLGYNDLCEDFDIPYKSLVPAAKKYLELARDGMFVVFFADSVAEAAGRQSAVQQRLEAMARA